MSDNSDGGDFLGVVLGLGILAAFIWGWSVNNPEMAHDVWTTIKSYLP